jgi:hypothetical protein
MTVAFDEVYVEELGRVTMPDGEGIWGRVIMEFVDSDRPSARSKLSVGVAISADQQVRFRDAQAVLLAKALEAIRQAAAIDPAELVQMMDASFSRLQGN